MMWRSGPNYREGLIGTWKPDWTPEYAKMAAEKYDRTVEQLQYLKEA
ncbi:hypothetical protein LJC26_04595 [Desulfovibrio sp. OttesenSCG-928-O18]|nr:hypothetical protein [Desulfovibrio sp. OttesenSCG-928-O18]